MNIKRGMFRLWVVGSTIWIALIIAVNWHGMANPWVPTKAFLHVHVNGDDRYLGFDDITRQIELASTHTEVQFEAQKLQLFVREQALEDREQPIVASFLSSVVAERDAEISQLRFARVGWTVFYSLIGPAIAFVVGAALIWIAQGFRRA